MVTTEEQTRSSITIAAAPAVVMAAIADFESYPRWAAEIIHSEILEPGTDGRAHRVRMHIDAAAIRDEQVLRYRWDGDRSVQWTLESSRILHSLDGSYTLTATDAGTLVTYRLTLVLKVKVLGVLRRQAERIIIERALAGLARHVMAPAS
ncbi:cyclase [Amycolatopsis orientalis]|uniref:Cyclase n=1 Tax=Amycolatopsis orientalis TaxID=31958 RepID=A0A193C4W6_AMYOR|nr:SRPBCC family protein [Amycolatopsis orientalis]ANN19522.1 cyclase [Amycolatopsis orientalis]